MVCRLLDDRKQQVALKGSSSPCASVTSGVPQGSIGPLLFILAMDPATSLSISNFGVIRIYTDDINYYKLIMSSTDLLAVQNTISVWVGDNGLRLNATKTKSLVISRKRAPPVPNITMVGTPIEQISSFKLLVVTVSSWAQHIQVTCCKTKKVLGLLYRSFGLAGELCLTRLYMALVRPLLGYCDCVWSPEYVIMLERVQSFAADSSPL